jgi:hypothetical protein
MTYYRVFDSQRGVYFAVGYNAKSNKEPIECFQDYICNADNVPKRSVNSLRRIADWLQGVTLEKSKTKFNEDEIL